MKFDVLPIEPSQTYDWLIKKHYLHRIPSISYAFGLYDKRVLIGVVTYGTPLSSTLRKGVAGEQYANIVIELNRLVINDNSDKNAASFFIGRSLKLLPKPSIVISYADTAQGHIGYVYQATNFIYTGLSAKITDYVPRGKENLHHCTISDKSRGMSNRAQWLKDTYGENLIAIPRSRKHRYVYIVADKITKTQIIKSLNYKQYPYPKGENFRYDAGGDVPTQQILFNNYDGDQQ